MVEAAVVVLTRHHKVFLDLVVVDKQKIHQYLSPSLILSDLVLITLVVVEVV
jgi:hypothetical protein